MKLFSKKLYSLIAFFWIATSLIGGILIWASLESFKKADQQDIRIHSLWFKKTFFSHFNYMESKLADWTDWNESYEYTAESNEAFSKNNLLPHIIEQLGFDFVAYLNADLRPITALVLENGKLTELKHKNLEFLNPNYPLIRDSHTELTRGFVNFGGIPAFAVARSVSKAEPGGKRIGRTVFLRRIDKSMLEAMVDEALTEVTMSDFQTGPFPQHQLVIKDLTEELTMRFGETEVLASFPIVSLDGQTISQLNAKTPRFSYKIGLSHTKTMILILVSAMFAITLMILASAAWIQMANVAAMKNTNEIIQHKDNRLRALIDSIPGYVSWFDRSLCYLGVNQKLASDFNLHPDEFLGKKIGFQTSEKESELKQELIAFFDSSETWRQTIVVITQKGSERRFLVTFEKYNSDQEVVVVGIDYTNLWQAEEQSNRDRLVAFNASRLASLGEMASGIAHEINNPLSIIEGACYKIEKNIHNPSKVSSCEDAIHMIQRMVVRISKIITGLRTFARDGTDDKIEISNLENIVKELASICEQRFRHKEIDLRINLPGNPIFINCKQVQIGQILVNLLNNSFDAVAELKEKWTSVDIEVKDSKVFIAITDSGKGIPDEVVEKIMNPFFTTKPVGKGTGLGLSIAKKIATEHHGDLYYDTSCPNTRMILVLPLATAADIKQVV